MIGGDNNQRNGINILIMFKGEERYIFKFDDENRANVLREFGKFSANKELSFSWYDAAVMSQRVKNLPGSDDVFCGGK